MGAGHQQHAVHANPPHPQARWKRPRLSLQAHIRVCPSYGRCADVSVCMMAVSQPDLTAVSKDQGQIASKPTNQGRQAAAPRAVQATLRLVGVTAGAVIVSNLIIRLLNWATEDVGDVRTFVESC